MMPTVRLLSLLLLAISLPGQDDRLSEREQEMDRRIRQSQEGELGDKLRAERAARGNLSEEERQKMADAERERMTPEERLARTVSTNASAYCRFVAAVKPQKLMPGQAGVIVVSALLNGQAVLPSPAPLEFLSGRQQGFVTLGEPGFHPADLARQAAGYAGRPVYDNYAIFEVPVAVAADAKIGDKQPVVLDFRFDIYDGVSAQPIGRFVDRARAEIEVGRTIDPQVVGVRVTPSIEGAASATEPGSPPTGEGTTQGPAPDENLVRGVTPLAPAAPQEGANAEAVPASDASTGWSPPPDDSGFLPLPVWLGGGALLLVIGWMLVRRK